MPVEPGAPSQGGALLMGRVARRYYLRGQSKKEIADALGISRFKVARLLDEAVASGVVRIEIRPVDGIDLDLSTRLEEQLGLDRCLVVDPGTGTGPEPGTRRLAAVAADVVGDVVRPGDVLGLPWSRTIHAMVHELSTLPHVEVVQLCGDQAVPDHYASAVEVATRAARLAGGPAHVFFAPLVVDESGAAVAIRRQPAVADALARARQVTVAFVGVGAWQPGLSSIHDAVGRPDREDVRRRGVVGEIAGTFYDAAGRLVPAPLTERLVAVDGDVLAAIPRVVGIAGGAGKATSVLAAVRGGLLHSLVVDRPLATSLAGAAGLAADAVGSKA